MPILSSVLLGNVPAIPGLGGGNMLLIVGGAGAG